MVRFFILISIMLVGLNTYAKDQNDVELKLSPIWGNERFELSKIYKSSTTNELIIKVFKFYVTNLQLSNQSKTVYTEKKVGHLIDFSETGEVSITLKNAYKKEFNTINFTLGVDSLTNDSGVMGGDLDPTKGMYWSWQSGYINFKFEGEKISNGISTPFQYHLGGYKAPYNSVAKLKLDVDYKSEIEIKFSVSLFLKLLNEVETQKIMSPSVSSVKCMQYVTKCFYI